MTTNQLNLLSNQLNKKQKEHKIKAKQISKKQIKPKFINQVFFLVLCKIDDQFGFSHSFNFQLIRKILPEHWGKKISKN